MIEYFLIAEIISIYDSNGFVEVKSFSDFPDRFFVLKEVYIDVFGTKKKFFVENVKELKSSFLLKFKGFNSGENLDFIIGKKIFIDDKFAVQPEEGTYFIHDLVGSDVYYKNEFFGKLTDVMQLPANDVYVVIKEDKSEILIPALKSVIKSFSAENKRLDIADDFGFYDDEN